MVAAGLPAVAADASSTVALFPGTVASTWAYRREFAGTGGLRAANGAAMVWFIAAGAVRWPETLAMLAASVVGGYLGARLTHRLPAGLVRAFIVVPTATVTVVFFVLAI